MVGEEKLFQLVENAPKLPEPALALTVWQEHFPENVANQNRSFLENFRLGIVGQVQEYQQLDHEVLFPPVIFDVRSKLLLILKVKDYTFHFIELQPILSEDIRIEGSKNGVFFLSGGEVLVVLENLVDCFLLCCLPMLSALLPFFHKHVDEYFPHFRIRFDKLVNHCDIVAVQVRFHAEENCEVEEFVVALIGPEKIKWLIVRSAFNLDLLSIQADFDHCLFSLLLLFVLSFLHGFDHFPQPMQIVIVEVDLPKRPQIMSFLEFPTCIRITPNKLGLGFAADFFFQHGCKTKVYEDPLFEVWTPIHICRLYVPMHYP